MLKRKIFWGAALIVLSVIVLISSGLGIYNIIIGPEDYGQMTDFSSGGAYVQAEISVILDIFAEEKDESGQVVGAYAVIPYGEEYYMAMYIPEKYLESARKVYANTTDYMDGKLETLNDYFVVTGTIRAVEGDLSEPYTNSMEGLEDYALGYVLEVGAAGYLPTGWVIVLTGISALCFVSGILIIAFDIKRKS